MAGPNNSSGWSSAGRAAAGHWHRNAARFVWRSARDSRRRPAGIETAGPTPVANVLRAIHRDGLVLPGTDEIHPRAGTYRATASSARLRAAPVSLILDVARSRSWPVDR